jgi:acetolactate synthase-1/3 small subunit
MRHIISALLENEAGALSRVVGLFSARGYNIETLTVAPTEDATLSRMTIVTSGSDDVIEQITKHLNRLIEIVKVVDLTEGAHIERELMLIKVRAVGKEREEMKRTTDIFRGRIIDVTEKTYTIELTGPHRRLGYRPWRAHSEGLIHALKNPFFIHQFIHQDNHESFLRQRLRPLAHQRQEYCHHRLWLAGSCPRTKPFRVRLQSHGRSAQRWLFLGQG